jgi:radical SAM family protein
VKLPSLMRVVGYAHWSYQRLVKPRLPPRVQQLMSRAARSRLSLVSQQFNERYNVWRVRKPVTRVLGPQYRRSRGYIEIDITWACNLNCFNCNRSCEQAPTGDHMTVAQIERFIAESRAANYQWKRIRVLGGEPTVHKHFFEILDRLRRYRDESSPTTMIEVITNGHGEKVQRAIERIPADVVVNNTSKETKVQPHFGSFNIAPKDVPSYGGADFRNGCWVIENCGMGLGPNGYYVCAVAGGIDRIYGWNAGRRSLPVLADDMHDQLERFCSHCGHFKREHEEPFDGPIMSETWKRAYAQHRAKRPLLTRYGDDPRPAEELEPVEDLAQLRVPDTRSRPA